MATVLKNVLRFTGLVIGVPQAIPHALNVNGIAKAPRNVWVQGGGFTVTADTINVIVTRGSSGTATVDVAVEFWHSLEDAQPLPGGIPAGRLPFVMLGGDRAGLVSYVEFLLDNEPIAETGVTDATYVPTYLEGKLVLEAWTRSDATAIKTIAYTYSGPILITEVRKVFADDGVTVVAQVTWNYNYVGNAVSSATMTRDI